MLSTLAFVVQYGSISQTEVTMVVVSQPNQTVIDFYPENGFLVPEVPN